MKRYTDFLFRRRRWVLGLVLVVTLVSLSFFSSLKVSENFDRVIYQDDPQFPFYEEFVRDFGYDLVIVVAFETEDALSPETLSLVEALSSRFQDLENVVETVSLTTALELESDGEVIKVGRLVPEFPQGALERETLATRIRSNPLYERVLVNRDMTAVAIYLKVDEAISYNVIKREHLLDELAGILEREEARAGTKLYMGGLPMLAANTTKHTKRDISIFLPISAILVLASMFLIFRNYFLTVIPFLAILVSILWTLGVLALLTGEFNVITILIPTFVFVIGTSDCIHILSNFRDTLFQETSRRAAVARTLRLTLVPCLMTSLTTMVGFGSLLLSRNAALRELGAYSALGIGFAYLLAVTLVPALLSFLGYEHLENYMSREEGASGGLSALLDRLADAAVAWKRQIIAVSVVLSVALGCGALSKLRVEGDATNYFGSHTYIKASHDFINKQFAGTGVLYAVMSSPEETGSVLDPASLQVIDGFKRRMEAVPLVGKALGITDLIRHIGSRYGTGSALPESREAARQLLLLVDDQDLVGQYINLEQDRAVVALSVTQHAMPMWKEVLTAARAYAAEVSGGPVEINLTGAGVLLYNHLDPLVADLVRALGFAVVAITLLVWAMFRSIRVALLSLVPNIVPVLFTFGAMAILDIPLNLLTSPLACVAFGLAVDDTLHILARFRIEIRKDGDHVAAVRRTIGSVGKAVIFTTVVFVAGFCIFLFSSFQSSRNFGALVSFTLMGALVADLLLLPALVVALKPFGPGRQPEEPCQSR